MRDMPNTTLKMVLEDDDNDTGRHYTHAFNHIDRWLVFCLF